MVEREIEPDTISTGNVDPSVTDGTPSYVDLLYSSSVMLEPLAVVELDMTISVDLSTNDGVDELSLLILLAVVAISSVVGLPVY